MADQSWTDADENEQAEPLPPRATDHPLYQQAQMLMNRGDWPTAHSLLLQLLELYPDDSYLKQLESSARARSALLGGAVEVEPIPVQKAAPPNRLPLLIAGVVVSGLLCAVVTGLVVWQFFLPGSVVQTREETIQQLRVRAETALSSGDYDRAVVAYNELLELDPTDPQALEGLERARELRDVVSNYSDAIAEMEAYRWDNALEILTQIEAEQPGYRDVRSRIEFVRRQQELTEIFNNAETLFNQGDYEQAIQEYERLQDEDAGFERDTVRNRLFISYLQLGIAERDAAGSDPERLQAALDYFEQALRLRPDDAQARGESQLIRLYLAGVEEYEAENWAPVVSNLAPVYDSRPDFADRNAANLLYEAYLAWGDEFFADGDYEQALARYEEARRITNVDQTKVELRIVQIEVVLATPTPTPLPTITPTPTPRQVTAGTSSGSGGGAPPPLPTPTPSNLIFDLRSMSVRNNCSGLGYIHGVIWNAYNLPLPGITVRAFNETTGYGPLISSPSNADGIYQIVINSDQIPGLWAVQVFDGDTPVSLSWGQRMGGECYNGVQELKVDWKTGIVVQ